MKAIFHGISEDEFNRRFSTDDACLAYLAGQKWSHGFRCRKCGHTNYCHGKTPYSRRCTKCKTEESATAHTVFHRCRFHLRDAFRIAYLVCNKPKISSYKLSGELNIRHMTCWKFKTKILECLDNQEAFTDFEKAEFKKQINK